MEHSLVYAVAHALWEKDNPIDFGFSNPLTWENYVEEAQTAIDAYEAYQARVHPGAWYVRP